MPEIELPLGIRLTPLVLAYIPLIVFITGVIMKLTPAGFDKARFGQLISLVVAIVFSVVDGVATHLGVPAMLIRGVAFAVVANSGFDALKSIRAGVTRGGGE